MYSEDRNKRHNNRPCNCQRHHHHVSCCDCSNFFDLNVAGLTNNLNAKLLKNRCRYMEITTSGGYELIGRTDNVGIDYVDIKSLNGTVVTVLKDKIDHIKWLKTEYNC